MATQDATIVLAMTKGVLVPYRQPPVHTHFGAEQQKVIARFGPIVDGANHGIINGVAGTGKTAVVKHIVTTPVGNTPICVPLTVHQCMGGTSVAQLRPSGKLYLGGVNPTKVRRLVLEDAWMFSAEIVSTLDAWFRVATGNPKYPFGGIPQILLVGDWMGAKHLVDNHAVLSPSIINLNWDTHKMTHAFRWDATDQDDFDALVSIFHAAAMTIQPSSTPRHLVEFLDRHLSGSINNKHADHIALSIGKGDHKAQWEAYDKRKYKKNHVFVPRGMLSAADPRVVQHAFPVVFNMPIRFTSDILDAANENKVIVPVGEIALLTALRRDNGADVPPSVNPGIKGLIITIKRITMPGRPVLELPPTPHMVSSVEERAAKRARNDPDDGSSSKSKSNHAKLVTPSKWGFVPAWSLRIGDARNQTLHTRLSVDVYPLRFTDPKAMMWFYTAVTRGRLCTQIRVNTTFYKLESAPRVKEDDYGADAEDEEEEDDIYGCGGAASAAY